MSSKCVVELRDAHGTVHVATVRAESLYEAVLRGLNQLTAVGRESDDDNTVAQVEVEIHQEPTRHIVDVRKLLKLLEDKSARPGSGSEEEKLRKLLGTR